MAKSKSPRGTGKTGSATRSGSGAADDQRQRMIAESAYFRAMQRGFRGGDPAEDWLAAEREISRLLPAPAQQQRELAAYRKLRADVQKMLADAKDTLSGDTIRQSLDDARERLRAVGEHTAEAIDKAIASVEKEMLGASRHMGARLENFSERTADVFYIWRDRGSLFLAQAAKALGDWTQEVGARLGQQSYRTGEITAGGELECTACGERLRLETPAHLPLCPKCHKTEFRRVA